MEDEKQKKKNSLNKPKMILAFLIKGLPKISTMTIVTKDKKPNPKLVAEPHPTAVRSLPPPQLGVAELDIKLAPIRMTTVPVIQGGKMFRSLAGGTNARSISNQAVAIVVPINAPYASGQARRVMVPSAAIEVGQVPLE